MSGSAPAYSRAPRFEETERRGVGVEAGVERELEMVERIVGGRVGSERAVGAVLEALVDGQDDEFAGAGEFAGVHDARQVGERAGVVAAVPGEDFLDAWGEFHRCTNLDLLRAR